MTLATDFKDFINLLNKHQIEYLVVGGYAMAFHGRPRFTGDLDIWIKVSESNAEKMLTVLKEFGFSSLGYSKEDFLKDNIINQIGYPPLRIDILTSIDGVTFLEAIQQKRTIIIDSIEVAFIGIKQLVENKTASNRPQDIVDVATLKKSEKVSELDKASGASTTASRLSLANYSLAIMPSATILQDVAEMKQQLKTAIGKSYGSANADGHISLDGFEASEEDYPYILAEYRRIVSELDPFDIVFSGFDDFDRGNFSAFYIKLTEDSSDKIRERTAVIMKAFDKKIKKQYMRKWADESKNPHMSIGRRLSREWIALAHSIFTNYEASFHCNAFAIRKYNDKRRQYDVVDVLPLLGAPAVQLDLFNP
jgi:2'-5' RNA ligase